MEHNNKENKKSHEVCGALRPRLRPFPERRTADSEPGSANATACNGTPPEPRPRAPSCPQSRSTSNTRMRLALEFPVFGGRVAARVAASRGPSAKIVTWRVARILAVATGGYGSRKTAAGFARQKSTKHSSSRRANESPAGGGSGERLSTARLAGPPFEQARPTERDGDTTPRARRRRRSISRRPRREPCALGGA